VGGGRAGGTRLGPAQLQDGVGRGHERYHGRGHVEESLEINILLTMTVAELLMQFEYTSYFYLRKK
jgi:hypothetical protein